MFVRVNNSTDQPSAPGDGGAPVFLGTIAYGVNSGGLMTPQQQDDLYAAVRL